MSRDTARTELDIPITPAPAPLPRSERDELKLLLGDVLRFLHGTDAPGREVLRRTQLLLGKLEATKL